MTSARLLADLVEAGEPSRETLHGSLKLGMEVYEGAQLISQPGESDLIFPSTCLELFDTPIGEVHDVCPLGEGCLEQGTLLLQVNSRRPD